MLNHDPDHIETLRRIWYESVLWRCHADGFTGICRSSKAEVLINAMDDPQTNLQLTEMVKEHFPHLQILPAPAMSTTTFVCVRQALKSRSVKPSKVR
ncbi:hypothetical protein ACVXHA_28755 [Escherichia coli]